MSYWANGWLANIAGIIAAGAALAFLHPAESVLLWASGMTVVWLFIIAATVWQVVGVWRSAGKHRARGGSGFWAGAARFMLVIGCIAFARTLIVQAVPQVREIWNIAAGDPSIGAHELRILRNGTELEFAGGITFGITGEVKKAIDSASAIRVIHLNSQGGRIEEARQLRDLIRERNLITYTSAACASACTIAFMGGKQRYISPYGKLGFHRGTFPGSTEAQIALAIEPDRRAMAVAGVANWFIDRAFSTPNSSVWWPTTDELKRANVITAVASPADFAISGAGSKDFDIAERADQSLLRLSVFAAIREADPNSYSQIRDAFVEGMKSGRSESEITALARPMVTTLIAKYLPISSDEALVEMAGVTVTEIDAIGAQDADACYNFLYPDPDRPQVVLSRYVDSNLLQREIEAEAAVIRSGMKDPQPVPNEDDISGSRQFIVKQLARKYEIADIAGLGNPAIRDKDHAKSCKLTGAFFKEILALPRSGGVRLLRWLYRHAKSDAPNSTGLASAFSRRRSAEAFAGSDGEIAREVIDAVAALDARGHALADH